MSFTFRYNGFSLTYSLNSNALKPQLFCKRFQFQLLSAALFLSNVQWEPCGISENLFTLWCLHVFTWLFGICCLVHCLLWQQTGYLHLSLWLFQRHFVAGKKTRLSSGKRCNFLRGCGLCHLSNVSQIISAVLLSVISYFLRVSWQTGIVVNLWEKTYLIICMNKMILNKIIW